MDYFSAPICGMQTLSGQEMHPCHGCTTQAHTLKSLPPEVFCHENLYYFLTYQLPWLIRRNVCVYLWTSLPPELIYFKISFYL